MTPRAAAIVAKRKQRKAEVEARHFARLDEGLGDRERQKWAQPKQEDAAQTIFHALQYGSAEARELAQQILKRAPDEMRAEVMRLAESDSAFKKRRSRQANGY